MGTYIIRPMVGAGRRRGLREVRGVQPEEVFQQTPVLTGAAASAAVVLLQWNILKFTLNYQD